MLWLKPQDGESVEIHQDNASKKLIAYHEAGHAIVGSLLPHHDAVNKVTVIPRGQAPGAGRCGSVDTKRDKDDLLDKDTKRFRVSWSSKHIVYNCYSSR